MYVKEHRIYNEMALKIYAKKILSKCSNKTILKLKDGRYSDLECKDTIENEVNNFIRDCGKWAIKKVLKENYEVEKDKKFREALLHTLKEFKVNKIDFDEIVFWVMKDIKRIYFDEEL